MASRVSGTIDTNNVIVGYAKIFLIFTNIDINTNIITESLVSPKSWNWASLNGCSSECATCRPGLLYRIICVWYQDALPFLSNVIVIVLHKQFFLKLFSKTFICHSICFIKGGYTLFIEKTPYYLRTLQFCIIMLTISIIL